MLHPILANWLDSSELRDLQIYKVTGGLSGARLWRVTKKDQQFCLRRWPKNHPSAADLNEIHGLIEHVWNRGLRIVPLPQRSVTHQTIFHANGFLWEFCLWLPGEICTKISPSQAATLLQTLARFHLVTAQKEASRQLLAPGLQQRLAILHDLRDGALARFTQAVGADTRTALRDPALELISLIRHALPHTITMVESVAAVPLPLQWCLRDVHLENCLFTGQVVSGLVDFGAACRESVAGDIARLVGSFPTNEPQVWQECLASYEKVRPLLSAERRSIAAYDAAGLTAAATNWLRWLFIEHKNFSNLVTIEERLFQLASRLKMRRKQNLIGE